MPFLIMCGFFSKTEVFALIGRKFGIDLKDAILDYVLFFRAKGAMCIEDQEKEARRVFLTDNVINTIKGEYFLCSS